MNLFKTPVQKVADQSSKILDVFTSTVADLGSVNARIDDHVAEHQEKISKLTNNLQTLHSVKANNEKVISKINKIFE